MFFAFADLSSALHWGGRKVINGFRIVKMVEYLGMQVCFLNEENFVSCSHFTAGSKLNTGSSWPRTRYSKKLGAVLKELVNMSEQEPSQCPLIGNSRRVMWVGLLFHELIIQGCQYQ